MTFSRAVRVSAPVWLLSLVWLAATPATAQPPASIHWTVVPSQTTLTLGGQLGTAIFPSTGFVAPIEILEVFNAEPQTFAGTSGEGGAVNSTLSTAIGSFTSYGNTFLSSLNLGPQPPSNKPIGQLLTSMVNNGNWMPTGSSATGILPGNAAFAVGPDGANGRMRLFGMAGDLTSNDISTDVTVSGDFNSATFNPNQARITGTLGFSLIVQGNEWTMSTPVNVTPELFVSPIVNNGLGTLTNEINNPTAGSYSRDGADYLMHVSFLDLIEVAAGIEVIEAPNPEAFGYFFSISLGVEFTARANIAVGDANWDGIVDVSDLNLAASNWQQSGAFRPGNVNGDGIVDISDLNLIAANWQNTTPPPPGGGAGGPDAAPVPEPATLLLFGLGLVGLLTYRRRRR